VAKVTRQDLLRMKKFIADRVITLVEDDPVLRREAQVNRHFQDMLASAIREIKPSIRLWALDVVISEDPTP